MFTWGKKIQYFECRPRLLWIFYSISDNPLVSTQSVDDFFKLSINGLHYEYLRQILFNIILIYEYNVGAEREGLREFHTT